MSDTIGHFSIYGDFKAAEITAALKLQPSHVRPKNSWIEGASSPSMVEEWELYCPEDLAMREQIAYLTEELWPRADALRPLAMLHHADFNISGKDTEVVELSPEQLSRLAQMHVHLNCFFTAKDDHAD